MDPFTVISGLGSFLGQMLNYGEQRKQADYQQYANERDFQYQQDIQQQIFNREDNAVQRRMADLEAAGLNPNLAAGSAAGAGTVVGRSNTPGYNSPELNAGAVLDTIKAAQQIKAQQQETKNAKIEEEILEYQKSMAANAFTLDTLNTAFQLGLPLNFRMDEGADGKLKWTTIFNPGLERPMKDTIFYKNAKNQFQTNEQALQYYINQNSMMSKDLQFYNSDKIFDYAARTVGLGLDLFSPFGNLKGLNKYNRR